MNAAAAGYTFLGALAIVIDPLSKGAVAGIDPFTLTASTGVTLMLCSGSYLTAHLAGGPKEVPSIYEYMWDYARKDGGGGQTQKFKDGAHRLVQKINPFRKPAPQVG